MMRSAGPKFLLGCYAQSQIPISPDPRVRMIRTGIPKFVPVCNEGTDLKEGKWGNLDEGLSYLPQPVQLVGSSNGLLLYCSDRRENRNYTVCNPVTRQFQILPGTHRASPYAAVAFTCQGVEPSLIGMQYEIIRVAVRIPEQFSTTLEMEIFSSTTGEWREASLVCESPFTVTVANRPAVVIDQMIYFEGPNRVLVAYDRGTELVKLIELPDRDRPYPVCWSDVLEQSEGKMCFVRADRFNLEVWELVDEKGEWILKHHLTFPHDFIDSVDVIHIHPEKQHLLLLILGTGLPYWYDFHTGRLTSIGADGNFHPDSFLYEWPCPPPHLINTSN